MRPEQKIVLSCRQTGERAERLLEWLEQNHGNLREDERALRDDIEVLAARIGRLAQSVSSTAAVGITGPSVAARSDLLAALIAPVNRPIVADGERPQLDLETLRRILPREAAAGCSVVIRYQRGEVSAAPKGFPFRLGLLSQLDVLKILGIAYLTCLPSNQRPLAQPADIEDLFTEAERHLTAHAVPGLSARDVVDLREFLHGERPDSRDLRVLAASGYWERLAEIVAHLPDQERTRLVSLLWGHVPEFTRLYRRLVDGLELLGNASETFCQLDALATRERSSGWLGRHPLSVIASQTLIDLAEDTTRKVVVARRHGSSTEIDRFVIAALAADICLNPVGTWHPGLEGADVLEFPSVPSGLDLEPTVDPLATPGQRAASGHAGDMPAIVRFLSEAKASYLFDRFSQRNEVTSLSVCTAERGESEELLREGIGDWVEIAQGENPHVRERKRAGLFVVATEPDTLRGAMVGPGTAVSSEVEAYLDQVVTDVLGDDQDWVREWIPNRPFRNVFLFRRADGADGKAGERMRTVVESESVVILDKARGGDPQGGPGRRRPGEAAGGGPVGAGMGSEMVAAALARAVVPASAPPVKTQQLTQQLSDLRRRLQSRFVRHYRSNDAYQIADWRRQITNVALSRLRQAAQRGRLGALQKALTVGEEELSAVFARLEHTLRQSAESEVKPAARRSSQFEEDFEPAIGEADEAAARAKGMARPEDYAFAAVSYWNRAMRQVGRSQRLCRHLQVPTTLLPHVIDELAIGAVRSGLVARMTDALQRAQATVPSRIDCSVSLVAIAQRHICAYLEMPATVIRAEIAAIGGFGGVPAARPSRSGAWGGVNERSVAEDWCQSYAALVEANIAAAPLLTAATETDRELGELLADLSSSAFEVEL